MKLEAVIFDWAGTTVDYGCFAPVRTFIELFQSYGIEATFDETRKPMGMLKWDHIKTMLAMPNIEAQWIAKYGRPSTDGDIDEMHDCFTTNLLKILDDYCDVKPYVLETIDELRKMNVKIGSTTGYTDEMMKIVVPKAKEHGYAPDFWITPDSTHHHGRPYPYMIFHNMEALGVTDINRVIKVGDTISDIKEARAAGVLSVGILEGSSLMGLTQEEYEALNETDRANLLCQLTKEYQDAGADHVIKNMKELIPLIKSL